MPKHGKKYLKARERIPPGQLFAPREALELVK
jgi:hypothetical protein